MENKTIVQSPRALFVSPGNRKTGLIPSVSLTAITTCRRDAPCFKKCYAAKCERVYKGMRDRDAENTQLYYDDPDGFFDQLKAHFILSRYFRMHVSGDIPDAEYFTRLADAARAVPTCRILIFTKKYWIVNDYVRAGHAIPENLVIIFSDWLGGFLKASENPFNFPVCKVKLKTDDPGDGLPVCPGSCQKCIAAGLGCWNVKRGGAFYINMH